ncbi:28322_t:CDS:2 [Dentiscutata erythropus]|uniref:28322_t:CDS:1 n=1 Tax=Dentiscutata erythropus TaxID=1348616 RepID=A0A9N9CZP5_9GLOM|nr:28322_t:CDS:2 [Dentiscutata erythropus]
MITTFFNNIIILVFFDDGILNNLYQFEGMFKEDEQMFQNHIYNSFLGKNNDFRYYNTFEEYRDFDFLPLFDHNRFLRYDNNNLLPSCFLPPRYRYHSKPFSWVMDSGISKL